MTAYTNITNGSLPDATIVMANFNALALPFQIYTGTGFNSVTTTGTDEQSVELDAIGAGRATNYVVVEVTAKYAANSTNGSSYVQLKVQSKETGGAYGDITGYHNMAYMLDADNGNQVQVCQTFRYVYTPTAGEKSNGLQLKVFTKSVLASGTGGASATNVQTLVYVL